LLFSIVIDLDTHYPLKQQYDIVCHLSQRFKTLHLDLTHCSSYVLRTKRDYLLIKHWPL
jgi:hypothetical protein